MGDISEQAYSDKLAKVLDYTIEALKNKVNKNEAEEAAISFFQSMATEVAVTAGIIAALAFNPASGPFVLAGAWILAGYSAAVFIYDTVNMLIDLADIDLCDEAALQQMGNNLAGSVVDLGVDLLASATLGAVGRLSSAISDAAEYVGLSAWRLWRRLKEKFGTDATNGRTCSFDGDTLVLTEVGKTPIRDIRAGDDRVWARDELSGDSSWRDVVAHYSNRYEETVHVTAIDMSGNQQTIKSNRIHPYFTRVAAGALLAVASTTSSPLMSSEGHHYEGDIVGGIWVDAQYLRPGDELFGASGNWQTVVEVEILAEPLQAFNLTVDEYSTYFVTGNVITDGLWVHNDCYDPLPNGGPPAGFARVDGLDGTTDFDQPRWRADDPDGGDNGRVIYRGHDGRYYDEGAHPPGPRPSGWAQPNLSAPATFNRGSRTFPLIQGNANSGWKHIYDRHVTRLRTRWDGNSKFPVNYTEQDIKNILEKTIRHGTEGDFNGEPTFTYRMNYNNVGYRNYRVTIDVDGNIKTFHPLGEDP